MIVTETNADLMRKTVKQIGNIERQLVKIAAQVRLDINERTQKGKNEDGGSFKRYSPAYKKYKTKKGRPSSPVNLTFTGDMLKSSRVHKIMDGVEIYFPDNAERNKGKWNEDKGRPFFGIDKKQENYIIKEVDKFMGKVL